MWKFVPSCFRRHRRKFFIIGGLIGGIAVLNSYLRRKLLEWESQRTAEFCDQIKRSSHFEGTINTCDSALISFAPKIREIVCSNADISPLVEQLKSNPPNKMQLWEQLKILVFVQAVGEMYAQCLLAILLRVQMSILGGYVFTMSRTNDFNSPSAAEQQQKYMSLIADFLSNGINRLLVPVKKAVESTLNSVPLNRSLKLQDISDIITAIRDSLSPSDSVCLPDVSSYIMPTNSDSISSNEFLAKIFNETKDVLECRDFNRVLTHCIDRGVSSIMDRISECFVFLSDGENFVNPHDFAAPLAKIIPMMHNVFNQHEPSEQGALVHSLIQQEPLNTFAANIYEAFSQNNV